MVTKNKSRKQKSSKQTRLSLYLVTFRVEGLAVVGFVLWVSVDIFQVIHAMRELTLVPVLALAILDELTTQLCLVATVIDLLLVFSALGG